MAEPTFITPPNWPQPPVGWRPDAGWTPDPSWGPAPDGWVFWTEPTAEVSPAASPRKKSRAGAIIGIVAGALVLSLLVGGGIYVWNVVLAPPTIPEENWDTAPEELAEDPHLALIDQYEETTAYIDAVDHGIDYEGWHTRADDLYKDGASQVDEEDVPLFTQMLSDLTDEIDVEHDAWVTMYSPKPENDGNATGTIQEEILDRVSGGVATLVVDDGCGEAACVNDDVTTVVHLNAAYVNRMDYDWEDVMMHEWAHINQHKYSKRMVMGDDLSTLFTMDPELHADCMVLAVKPDYEVRYNSVCTPEMLESAGNIWKGIVK